MAPPMLAHARSPWLAVTAAAALALAGCEKEGGTGSGSSGSSAIGSAASDPAIDALIADMGAYGEKSIPMLVKFDGDCGAIADQLLTLEPLAKSIRSVGAELEADP